MNQCEEIRPFYKCRMCGLVYSQSSIPLKEKDENLDLAFKYALESASFYSGRAVERLPIHPLYVVHVCEHKRFGIADLLGLEVVKQHFPGEVWPAEDGD